MNSLLLNIKNKLLDKKGVSILFALLLLLVVSMVSVTIVAASTSSVKRTSSIKESTQTNLTLDSAALLLKKELDNYTYTASVYATDNSNAQKVNSSKTISGINDYIENISKKCVLASNVDTNTSYASFNISSSKEELEDVKVDVSYDFEKNGGDVVFKLSINNSVMYEYFSLSDSATGYNHTITWKYNRVSYK